MSSEESGKRFHIGATRPRPVGRQDGGHRGAQGGVTTRAFGTRRPPLVRITCTSCLPSSVAVVASLRGKHSIFGKTTRASINRTSHHSRKGQTDPKPLRSSSTAHQAQEHLSSGGCSSLVLFILSPRGNPPHHAGVGYYTTLVARTSINSCGPCSSSSTS